DAIAGGDASRQDLEHAGAVEAGADVGTAAGDDLGATTADLRVDIEAAGRDDDRGAARDCKRTGHAAGQYPHQVAGQRRAAADRTAGEDRGGDPGGKTRQRRDEAGAELENGSGKEVGLVHARTADRFQSAAGADGRARVGAAAKDDFEAR